MPCDSISACCALCTLHSSPPQPLSLPCALSLPLSLYTEPALYTALCTEPALYTGLPRSLLESIFPRHVIEYMALAAAEPAQQEQAVAGGAAGSNPGAGLQERLHLARWHPQVTILFADIVGFTDMCRQVSPGGAL